MNSFHTQRSPYWFSFFITRWHSDEVNLDGVARLSVVVHRALAIVLALVGAPDCASGQDAPNGLVAIVNVTVFPMDVRLPMIVGALT